MEVNVDSLLEKALYHAAFRKAVFSKSKSEKDLKMIATPVLHRGQRFLRCETFQKDGKAIQKNFPYEQATACLKDAVEHYRQINLYTQDGEAELRVSSKGSLWCKDRISVTEKAPDVQSHNREKHYIIDKDEAFSFLYALDIVDQNGRILDKKQSKFRQINHFLQFVRDALPYLPKDKTLYVWDLCCGKSYLTFAVYYYLTVCEHRQVCFYAVDRKQDMIEKCRGIADRLQYDGLRFLCMDITDFKTDTAPDLVLSLHACDIATDIVLAHAIKNRARVILSAPCCHHEMNRQIRCKELNFIQKHGILKQKLCDAATDALRALRLEAEGYQVSALEFIDPEETPKNTLLRAYLSDGVSRLVQRAALQEYERICQYLNVSPYLDRLLSGGNQEE